MLNYIILIFALLSSNLYSQENTIKVYSTKAGRDTSHKLIYPEMKNVVRMKSLSPSTYKFYIEVDDNCKISVLKERSPKITDEEMIAFNDYIGKYNFEYYENDVLAKDCSQLGSLFFPIKIIVQ